jgi:hypothetical protein
MKNYALFENGMIHTDNLSKSEAEEMLERHKRMFPEMIWDIMRLPADHCFPYA